MANLLFLPHANCSEVTRAADHVATLEGAVDRLRRKAGAAQVLEVRATASKRGLLVGCDPAASTRSSPPPLAPFPSGSG